MALHNVAPIDHGGTNATSVSANGIIYGNANQDAYLSSDNFTYSSGLLTITGSDSTDDSPLIKLVNAENADAADVTVSFAADDKGYAMGIQGNNDNFEMCFYLIGSVCL